MLSTHAVIGLTAFGRVASPDLMIPFLSFSKTPFTHWLEAMSLMGKMDEGILMLNGLHIYISSALSISSSLWG